MALAELRVELAVLDAQLRDIDKDWRELEQHINSCFDAILLWKRRGCLYTRIEAGDITTMMTAMRDSLWRVEYALWSWRLAVSFPNLKDLQLEHWRQETSLEARAAQLLLTQLADTLSETIQLEPFCGWREAVEIKRRCL